MLDGVRVISTTLWTDVDIQHAKPILKVERVERFELGPVEDKCTNVCA